MRVEDKTLSANVSFEEDQGASTTPDSDYGSSSGNGYVSGIRSLLPGTGGVVLALGVGALLVASGFLVRRVTR